MARRRTEPQPKCEWCKEEFTPKWVKATPRYCCHACNLAALSAEKKAATAARQAKKAAEVARLALIACSRCVHGKPNRHSESGYECGAQAAMTCRPLAQQLLFKETTQHVSGEDSSR